MAKNVLDKKKISVGLDIGTTKICALVIEDAGEGAYNILSCAITENTGVNRGVIVNIEKTVANIQKVIKEAEQQSGIEISKVVAGLAGDHIESLSEVSTITISNQNQVVGQSDVDRVIDELRKSKISADRKIIHIVPYEYIVDGQDGIINPIGMYGVRLQANVHIVSGMRTAVQNINRCVEENAGLILKDIVLEPIASSIALLTEDEQEVGVCLIDIGGGTTDITIFKDNVLRFTTVIGIGGNKVTDDIKSAFKTTAMEAERIKCSYGHTFLPSLMRQKELFIIRGVGGMQPQEVSKEELCEVIQPRMEELLEMCNEEVIKSGFANTLGAGIVITGGSALLQGTDELAARIFNAPVRIGYPSGEKYRGLSEIIESPKYSTAVGLALHSLFLDDLDNNKSTLQSSSSIDSVGVNNIENKKEDKDEYDNQSIIDSEIEEPITTKNKKESWINKTKDWLSKL